jgi:hypothetical protein
MVRSEAKRGVKILAQLSERPPASGRACEPTFVHPPAVRHEARTLIAAGVNDCEIARTPASTAAKTSRDWSPMA